MRFLLSTHYCLPTIFFREPTTEILDLRHFTAANLAPLLTEASSLWLNRLSWDFGASRKLLLEYIDSRLLTGYVARRGTRILGYAFAVFEADKAIIGDLYASAEATTSNHVSETILHHLLELLQATPGITRIESQLLLYPSGTLEAAFAPRNVRARPRLYLVTDLAASPLLTTPATLPPDLHFEPWGNHLDLAAATLIHTAYLGHVDSGINDQYCTVEGARRFLNNVIRFPGCGIFDAANSFAVRNRRTMAIEGLLLASRIHARVGHITQICVSPAQRGRGLGRALLAHCARNAHRNDLTRLTLTVTESNTGALRLYERAGFVPVHRFDARIWDKQW